MVHDFADRYRDGLLLSADATKLSVVTIHRWLSDEAYWAKGRSREEVDTSIENSYLYGVVTPAGETVACLRVVTDEVTFGWVTDVFVEASFRGRGLGTWMVDDVVTHWTNAGLGRVLLATSDAHDVYARAGFVPLAAPERFMEIDRRPKF